MEMKGIFRSLAIAGVLALGATAVGATTPAVGTAKNATVGELLANGQISEQAVQQLIMHTGLTMDQAKADTLDQIVAKRWQNS
jgi:hypothetical protein